MKKFSIQFDHQLPPLALKLVADVEARDARRARLKLLKEAGARADIISRKKI